jgi:ubiquinone/menaquinone biosynthesis C-methylase UbiE
MKNVLKSKYRNIKFLLGEIENLPVADNSIDAVISNCVINLVPDKIKAFKEIFRVLKQGGRMLISDIVLKKRLPDAIKKSVDLYTGCISGAILRIDYLQQIRKAGFKDIKIMDETEFPMEFISNDSTVRATEEYLKIPGKTLINIAGSISSIKVFAKK